MVVPTLDAAPRVVRRGAPVRRSRAVDGVRAGACAAALFAMSAFARQGLRTPETAVFGWIHDLPDWLEPVVWLPMQAGTAAAPVVVAAGAALAWSDWRPALDAIVVGIGGWYLAKVVKGVVDRGRPASFVHGLPLRKSAPIDGSGFLSGHSTVAFGLATVLAPRVSRNVKLLAYGLASLVAVSRVYVGAHLPLDVAGGALFGTLLGWLWYLTVGEPSRPVAADVQS